MRAAGGRDHLVISNLVLAFVFAGVLAADTAAVAARHANWPFELAVGAVVCALTLFRGRNQIWAVTAGLVVCGAAGAAADVARLPSQPGFAATLALLVLGVVGVRMFAPSPAVLVAVAGVAVLVAGRFVLRGEYAVAFSFLGLLAWGGALAVGTWLRLLDIRRNLALGNARRDERLVLARELHDAVAHHVAGIGAGDRGRPGDRPGRTNAEIAADLFISLSPVKSHLASIQDKLGVRNRVEIAGWAWETGLAHSSRS